MQKNVPQNRTIRPLALRYGVRCMLISMPLIFGLR